MRFATCVLRHLRLPLNHTSNFVGFFKTANCASKRNMDSSVFRQGKASMQNLVCSTREAAEMSVAHRRSARILVAVDDLTTRATLINYLSQHMTVASVPVQRDAVRHVMRCDVSLVILGVRSSDDDNLDQLRRIRSISNVPVIVADGCRRHADDGVIALDLGADDYVVSPFSLRELLARIRAVLRWCDDAIGSRRLVNRRWYRFEGWTLDQRERFLSDPNGTKIRLTSIEYALLVALLDVARQPISREQLLHATRMHDDVADRAVDVQIYRLRRKLGGVPNAGRIIRTERGVGYVLEAAVECWG
jgi:two-component system, OmpR family, response regulator